MARREIRVPDLGDFKSVEIVELVVKPGDQVRAEQTLIVLETDKAAMEVPSPVAGTLIELKVAQGDRVSTGDLIAFLEADETAARHGAGGESRGPRCRADGSARSAAASAPAPEPGRHPHRSCRRSMSPVSHVPMPVLRYASLPANSASISVGSKAPGRRGGCCSTTSSCS